jgi:hypothetical protein
MTMKNGRTLVRRCVLLTVATAVTLSTAACDEMVPDNGLGTTAQSSPSASPFPWIETTTPETTTPDTTTPAEAPAVTTAAPQQEEPPETDPPRTKVPEILVGSWDGDWATIRFSASGEVALVYDKGLIIRGTVVIDGSRMTLHMSSGVETIRRWHVARFDAGYGYEFFNLTLDDSSYVREVAE